MLDILCVGRNGNRQDALGMALLLTPPLNNLSVDLGPDKRVLWTAVHFNRTHGQAGADVKVHVRLQSYLPQPAHFTRAVFEFTDPTTLLEKPDDAAVGEGEGEGKGAAGSAVLPALVSLVLTDTTPSEQRIANTCWPQKQSFPEADSVGRAVSAAVTQTVAGGNEASAKLLLMPDTPLDLTVTMTLPETLNASDLNGGDGHELVCTKVTLILECAATEEGTSRRIVTFHGR